MTTPTLHAVRWLASSEGKCALQRVRSQLPIQPKQVIRLRREFGDQRAQALAAVAPIMTEVEKKFGKPGALATVRGLQQSTHADIARYKADHIPPDAGVIDVCCGVGGDAVALASRGTVLAVDCDPAVCAFAAHNLNLASDQRTRTTAVVCQTAEQTIEGISKHTKNLWMHIDPDRRPGGYRVTDPNYSRPPADKISTWIKRFDGALVKLAPAATLPPQWSTSRRREWISHAGECRQQLAWFLPNQQAGTVEIKATVIDGQGRAFSYSINQDSRRGRQCHIDSQVVTTSKPEAFIFDFDPAIRAAGLSTAFADALRVRCIDTPAGFFTSDSLPFANDLLPLASIAVLTSCFEVLWCDRFDEKKLKRKIREFEPSSLEIKVRGLDVAPEKLRPRLLGKASRQQTNAKRPLTLLLSKGFAALAKRVGYSKSSQ